MSEALKVAILDDHTIFLDGISVLIGEFDGLYHIEAFTDPIALLQRVSADDTFDVIICDLIMKAMNGLAFLAALRSHTKTTPLIILSGTNSTPPIDEIIRLGGNGFVHKSVDQGVLKDAIQSVASGQSYFEDGFGDSTRETIMTPSLSCERTKDADMPLPDLAERQREVLRYIAQGASNKEIARALDISENTVKSHLKNIFVALDVNKRTACVRKAQMLGLI